ncbi:MAG: YibE/F family protein [Chloroflexi bacterium]|nr:YibE/F family protein [Chloroflexota bacterium]
MRAIAGLLLLSASFSACGDLNTGASGTVVEAHVTRVITTAERRVPGVEKGQLYQRLEVQLDSSLYRGERVEVDWGGRRALDPAGLLHEGDRVLLTVSRDVAARTYTVTEVVRFPTLVPFAIVLVVALLAVARLRGLAALAGLAASLAVFLLFIIPALQRGGDPLLPTVFGSVGVLTVAVFVVHGFGRKSVAALLGTFAGLIAVGGLGAMALTAARMSGFASEETIILSVASDTPIDVARLALAAVIVGSLGALVDMSVGQSSTTFELAGTDPDLRGLPLYLSALRVGRDHIGSLVNTLALAYFGGALPLVLLLSLGYQPLSVALNSEEMTLSILTVIVASIGLVLTVPVTTAIAVRLAGSSRGLRTDA